MVISAKIGSSKTISFPITVNGVIFTNNDLTQLKVELYIENKLISTYLLNNYIAGKRIYYADNKFSIKLEASQTLLYPEGEMIYKVTASIPDESFTEGFKYIKTDRIIEWMK